MLAIRILPLALAGMLLPAVPALAQTYWRPVDQAARGQYGGGFIEMLMTGQDPSDYGRGRAVYNQPSRPAYGQQPQRYRRLSDYEAPVPLDGDPIYRGQVSRGQISRGDVYGGEAYPPPPSPRQERRSASLGQPMMADTPIQRAIPARFQKQEVAYDGAQRPGTVVIDTSSRFLYLVQPGGRALRYGIGVGREGFSWKGTQSVSRKAEWPSWTPPASMLKRRPDLPRFMPGGPENPLGARALYLGSTLYRIHGTNEPHTIGQAVSSGCIRMTNDDVMDLYGRVRVGARVVVM
jgi:lipoprotein-anchoring transpeptidase ErfK/SrfK